MSILDLNQVMHIAQQAAMHAAQRISEFSPEQTAVELKSDSSPVTAADRAAETAIRQIIQQAFPEHGIYGEEFGGSKHAEYLWLIDPIDGTKSWVAGLPFWSIQIALWHNNEVVLGVSYAPAFTQLASVIKASHAQINQQPSRTSNVTEPGDMRLSSGNLRSLAENKLLWERYRHIVRNAERTRGYGDFYHYHALAAGQLDAVIESDVNILDIAALSLLVETAGGKFTDLFGQPVSLQTSSVLATATPQLHTQLLEQLHG